MELDGGICKVRDLVRNAELPVTDGKLKIHTVPGVNYVLELIK